MSNPHIQLPSNVLAALKRNNIIEAIKLLRQSSGLGLAEAKGMIDAYRRGCASETANDTEQTPEALRALVEQALGAGNKIEAIRLTRTLTGKGMKEAKEEVDAMEAAKQGMPVVIDGLAPGEVPRTSGSGRWIVAIVIIAVIGYILFSSGGGYV